MVRVGILVFLVPHLRGKKRINFSPLSMILAVGLSPMAFIMPRNISSIPNLLSIFTMKRCCILSNAYPVSIEMIIWFLFFINMVCHIYWFAYVKPSLNLKDKSHLIMVNDPFNVLLESACYFIKMFCIYIHQGYWPIIFSCSALIWLWYQGDAGLVKWVW